MAKLVLASAIGALIGAGLVWFSIYRVVDRLAYDLEIAVFGVGLSNSMALLKTEGQDLMCKAQWEAWHSYNELAAVLEERPSHESSYRGLVADYADSFGTSEPETCD